MATTSEKLENCEVCAAIKAKYTCPKCEVRTCSLACVTIHKKELECDGLRNKVKFVPLKSFTDLDLLSDYRLLEEIGRSVDQLQRDSSKRYTRQYNLPVHLYRLKAAVHQRGTNLEFMPQNFSRHKENTTYLIWKTNELFWRIEWIFPQAENTKWVDNRVLESERLSSLLERILDPINEMKDESENIESFNIKLTLRDRLQYYRAAGLSNIKIFLKAERVKKSDSRFYELDVTLTLKENLERKTIIEFPTLYIVPHDHSDMYEVIDTDEEEEKREPEDPCRNKGWIEQKRKTNKTSKKKDKSAPVNFFFHTDFTDSEEEDTDNREKRRKRTSNLDIPEYDKLVKMEH